MLVGIRSIQARLAAARRAGPPVRLLGFDIEGQGHAVLAIGDVETARNVAVYVPGMGNRLATVLSGITQVDATWSSAQCAGSPSTAVVAWWGYDIPPDVVSAGNLAAARSAAPLLRAFLDGLRASRRGSPAHLTLVAHSYGSVVSTLAARTLTLPIDDLLILGSPGTNARSALELNIPHGRVWVIAASRDPVARTPVLWHGRSPTRAAYGANVVPGGTGSGFRPSVTHGSYFVDPEPLAAIGLIVAARGGRSRSSPGPPGCGYPVRPRSSCGEHGPRSVAGEAAPSRCSAGPAARYDSPTLSTSLSCGCWRNCGRRCARSGRSTRRTGSSIRTARGRGTGRGCTPCRGSTRRWAPRGRGVRGPGPCRSAATRGVRRRRGVAAARAVAAGSAGADRRTGGRPAARDRRGRDPGDAAPAEPALLALVREELGWGVVAGPLDAAQRRRVALVLALLMGGCPGSGGTVVAP